MASVFAGCALGVVFWVHGAEPKLLGVLVAAAGLTLLGAIDDARPLSVWSRLLGQFLAAIVVVGTLPEDFRVFPDLMPAGRRGCAVGAGHRLVGERRQFPRRPRLDDGGAGRADDAGDRCPLRAWRGACLGRAARARAARRHARLRRLQQAPGADLSRRCRKPADRALPRLHADRRGAEQPRRGAAAVALHAGRPDDHAVPPRGRERADPLGAPHAFLSAWRDRRLERAASDDAHLPALPSARRARRRHGAGG